MNTTDTSSVTIPENTDNSALDSNPDQPWFTGANDDTVTADEQKPENSFRDPQGQVKALAILEQVTQSTKDVIRSRVLGDIWHLMHQFPISQGHGLRRPFARALRNAFFQYDPEDKANMESFLESRGLTWDYMLKSHPEWILQRVKRFVPPPEELLPRVGKVLYDFGPLLCAKSNQPVFNNKAWEVSPNVLENIRRGYYSDPPKAKLYYVNGRDKYGLLTYRCCRGMNAIEGGVHQNIIRWFGAFNAAPDFAVQLLRDYTLYHNLKVSLSIQI